MHGEEKEEKERKYAGNGEKNLRNQIGLSNFNLVMLDLCNTFLNPQRSVRPLKLLSAYLISHPRLLAKSSDVSGLGNNKSY